MNMKIIIFSLAILVAVVAVASYLILSGSVSIPKINVGTGGSTGSSTGAARAAQNAANNAIDQQLSQAVQNISTSDIQNFIAP